MAQATLSDYSSTLRIVGGELGNISMFENVVYQLITDKSDAPQLVSSDGKAYYYYTSLKVKNGFSGRNVGEGGSRPTFYPATNTPARYALGLVWQPIQLSGHAYYAGGLLGPPTLSIESTEMIALQDGWAAMMAINLLGQAKGWITTIREDGSSTTIKVYDTNLLQEGMRIDIRKTTDWTSRVASLTIDSIGRDTNTLTVASNSTSFSAGDYIVIEGCYGIGWDALGDIINNNADITVGSYIVRKALTTFANVSRSTYSRWCSTIHQPPGAGTAGEFDISWLFAILAKMQIAYGGGKVKVTDGLAHPFTIASLANKIPMTRQMGVNGNQIRMGQKGDIVVESPLVEGGGFTIQGIPGYKKYIVDLVNFRDIKIRWVEKPNFLMNGNGQVFELNANQPNGTHTWTGSYQVIGNLIAKPPMHGTLAGIELPTGLQGGVTG